MQSIKLVVLDVDGTLTDGGIFYGSNGVEYKRFSVYDGIGILAARRLGVQFAIITGRESECVKRRAVELKIDFLYQNVSDKCSLLIDIVKENGLDYKHIAYIGDDINDIEAMLLCGFIACPMNACKSVKDISNFVSQSAGGQGAVREILEHLLGRFDKGSW